MLNARRAVLVATLLCSSVARPVPAQQNDSASNDGVKPGSAAASLPALMWKFEGMVPGTWKGQFDAAAPGPRPPQYPPFSPENHAAFFGGDGTSLVLLESDSPVPPRFGLGEAITLEAWVRVKQITGDSYVYLVGKGRSRKESWADKNQNYSLRLRGAGGRAMVNFLFASVPAEGQPGDWHRWTSTEGFAPGEGWHHVAIGYTFGQPETIRGFVDGRRVSGTWDMGGATKQAPVQDADDLVLGTGNGGGAGNSLHGWLDEVAIHRGAVPDPTLAARYQRVRVLQQVRSVPPPFGKVLVEICEPESLGAKSWPGESLEPTETYEEDLFGFFELPHKYVDTGVRGDRANPFLLRATANVKLPPGKHRLLLRGRGATQLYVDGKPVLATPFPPESSDGHHEIPKDYLDLGPEFRFAPPGNRESWTVFESTGKDHFVTVESIVGSYTGNRLRRPELGETVVAISFDGSSSWELLSPGWRRVAYTDEGWAAYESDRRAYLEHLNAQRRATCLAQHRPFWDRRRAAAQEWLAKTTEVAVPELPAGFPARNPIDHFLAVKLAAAKQESSRPRAGEPSFHAEIQPLLQAHCVQCHQGERAQGALRLERAAGALQGGESGVPAIVPGHPEKSELLTRIRATGEEERMPPQGDRLKSAEVDLLERWILAGARWPAFEVDNVEMTGLTDDLSFLRRATLDTIGVVPSLAEAREFMADNSFGKRERVIDRLLRDSRWADHWVGYWQDVLAENPNILNPTLNNSGPFRWWIRESMLDNKPIDLFVTELLRMKGSERFGGPAGFGVASQNDVPPAAKGTIVSSAFLGVQMKCARCHDSPYHDASQETLFQLGAMLAAKPLEVPKTSSVPLDKLHQGGRKPLIQVTLAPGTKVQPRWPLGEFADESLGAQLAETPEDSRDRLAALVTAPQNERFAQVIANRVWQRFMGRGIVEPVDDWEKGEATHPELLQWLGRELVRSDYSLKHLARLILNSHAYQRATNPKLRGPSPLYAAPSPRRLTAEQLVDSLFSAMGKPFGTEEVNLDVDGQRDMGNSISLGYPHRAWMFASTSNERDRPSLSLPRVQAVVDVLAAFGWRTARQDPTSQREQASSILQPAVLANGVVSVWLTRLSDDHGITQLALQESTPDRFLEGLFLQLLTRPPTAEERAALLDHLTPGFDQRVVPASLVTSQKIRRFPKYVSWSNHLSEEANAIKVELEAAARRGDPPTPRLEPGWRERAEDVLWSLLNAPEWTYMP